MEPEGAAHAPQTSKGPTLTFIVEKKLPAGSRLDFVKGVSFQASAVQTQ